MFSIVIPLYNKELSITNTLKSVLNQSYTAFEVVIVNDGSTDNSIEKIKAFKDKRIRIIEQENGGVSSARNRGVKEAKYEWIAFLDADDLWMENKLELVRNTINTNKNIELVLHAFETCIVHKNKIIINSYNKNKGVISSLLQAIVNGLKIQTSAVVVKKELFEKDTRLFFREGVNNSEDREVWYKLACLKVKTFYVQEILSKYIVDKREESLTGNINRKFHFLKMDEKLKEFYLYLDDFEKVAFREFICEFNKKIILGSYWVEMNKMPEVFEVHLQRKKFKLLRSLIWLPKILKKIFVKII